MPDTNAFWTLLKPRLSESNRDIRLWAEMSCGSAFVAKRFQLAMGYGRLEKDRARVIFHGSLLTPVLRASGAPGVLRQAVEHFDALTGLPGAFLERCAAARAVLRVWDAELARFDDHLAGKSQEKSPRVG